MWIDAHLSPTMLWPHPFYDHMSLAPMGFLSLVPSFAYHFCGCILPINEFGGHKLIPICRPPLCMDMG